MKTQLFKYIVPYVSISFPTNLGYILETAYKPGVGVHWPSMKKENDFINRKYRSVYSNSNGGYEFSKCFLSDVPYHTGHDFY
jgi:hypothetical protein